MANVKNMIYSKQIDMAIWNSYFSDSHRLFKHSGLVLQHEGFFLKTANKKL